MIDLKGHAALITGSSKGVGRAIAEAYAQAGASVVIHGRQLNDDAQQVLASCTAKGVEAAFVAADLSEPTQQAVQSLFDQAISQQAKLDILVNNAGQYFDVPFARMTLERFEKTMRLNVTAPYFLTQLFANHWMANSVAGRVLMIGSVNGRLAEEHSTAYDTSKGAMEMMVKTLCAALAPKGIRVNGLAPGLVRTPQTDWLDAQPDTVRWMSRHTPNGQIPHADVCGAGAVYLVSDVAEHVHGHMLMVDGGMSAWQQPAEEVVK